MFLRIRKYVEIIVVAFLTSSVIVAGLFSGFNDITVNGQPVDRDYRQDMRNFVQGISAYTKEFNANFVVIPQNGHDLITEDGVGTGTPSTSYLSAIDGVGREDLFYGYAEDNVATPESERDEMMGFLDIAENNGVEVLVTDYCWTPAFVDDSYTQNAVKGYISFAADHRELDNIPSYPSNLYAVNSRNINSLAQAKNFLYLLDPTSFPTKAAFFDALKETNYDIIILDLFYNGEELSSSELMSLKVKANGGTRLVISYMSIGEAEDYRFYWQTEWETNPPSWLAEENPEWAGNYKVGYWKNGWKNIIYGTDTSYVKKIVDTGFDGVYLDIIDAFEYFEENYSNGDNDSSIPGYTIDNFFGSLIVLIIVLKKRRK